jgi:hypothetical protein
MSGLMDLLNSDLGRQIISGVSQQTNTNEEQTSSVLSSVLPAILGQMQNNASTPEGHDGLMGALMGGRHDGSILDNISNIFTGGQETEQATQDGAGILGHVFGGNQAQVENQLSQNTGIGSDKIGMIMKMVAPILMGYLARKAMQGGFSQNSNVSQSGGGLGDLLGSVLGGMGGQQQQQQAAPDQGLFGSILDQNGDGKVDLNDAMAAATKSGGLGGLLGTIGNIFKK